MLVEFAVGNYRSFAETQRLSMVSSQGGARGDRPHCFATGHRRAPYLEKAVSLFGANASGKSNLVRAIHFFREFVVSSAKDRQAGDPIDLVPFRLSRELREKPSEFEIVFIHAESLFQYGFSADQNRVHEEWLFETPGRPRAGTREIFRRTVDPANGKTVWRLNETHLKGRRDHWREATRDNALFLSTAAMLNSESLRPVFDWIRGFMRPLNGIRVLSPAITAQRCQDEKFRRAVIEFLKSADITIADIHLTESNFSRRALPSGIPDLLAKEIEKQYSGTKVYEIEISRSSDDGNFQRFLFADESDGTQSLFTMIGPLLDVFSYGFCLVVDEMHLSLHPHILNSIIEMFCNPIINDKNAQLIFTGHDTTILGRRLLHRDQIWFVEKNDQQASTLFPLSDFKVREYEAFQKAYLDGRFGAVPRLRSFQHAGE